jgi:glycyl-tRNA synthetase
VSQNKKEMGKLYKKDLKKIIEAIEAFTDEEKLKYMAELEEKGEITLNAEGQEFKITKDLLQIEHKERMVGEEKFIPHVIEPSFGIGRILYCIFEHSFKIRPQDAQRTYFNFPIILAPAKCVLLPLMTKPELIKKT